MEKYVEAEMTFEDNGTQVRVVCQLRDDEWVVELDTGQGRYVDMWPEKRILAHNPTHPKAKINDYIYVEGHGYSPALEVDSDPGPIRKWWGERGGWFKGPACHLVFRPPS